MDAFTSRSRLFFLFITAFAAPIILTVYAVSRYRPGPAVRTPEEIEVFPEAVTLGENRRLTVTNSDEFNPQHDADFLLISWFKIKHLPENGQRLVLMSRYNGDQRVRSGYAVAIDADNGRYRPAVYWLGSDGRGGWYNFGEFQLSARDWFMLAVSFVDGRYLGAHLATFAAPDKPVLTLLGGHDLAGRALPESQSDLVIAPPNPVPFVGRVGPIGIFARAELAGNLKAGLKEYLAEPQEPPPLFKRSQVRLWISHGATDQSDQHHEIDQQGNRKAGTGRNAAAE